MRNISHSATNMDISMENVRAVKAEHTVHVAQHPSASQEELPFTPSSLFLEGYTDCAQEALWYLTEVEKLPPSHPTVVKLKLHLYEQYRVFQIQQILKNALHMCYEGDVNQAVPDASLDRESESDVDVCDVIVKDDKERVSKSAIQNTEYMSKCEANVQDNSLTADAGNVQKNEKENLSNVKEHSSKVPGIAGQENESDSKLSPEAHMLAIALAEQIYAAFQGQDDISEEQDDLSDDLDYLSDTDNENENADEGFEEMVEP